MIEAHFSIGELRQLCNMTCAILHVLERVRCCYPVPNVFPIICTAITLNNTMMTSAMVQ